MCWLLRSNDSFVENKGCRDKLREEITRGESSYETSLADKM